MTLTVFVDDDAYDILYDSTGVYTIIRYASGLHSLGRIVGWDDLTTNVQKDLLKRLKFELNKHNYDDRQRPTNGNT